MPFCARDIIFIEKEFETEEALAKNIYKMKNSAKVIKTGAIRKLSNFNYYWTNTLYKNNLSNTAFCFTFFKGYKYN